VFFNSLTYARFLGAVLLLYHSLRHRSQNYMLLVASYLFYGWWDTRFLFLIVVSTAVDYAAGLIIDRGRLTRIQRLKPSVYVIAAAIAFVWPDWAAFEGADASWFERIASSLRGTEVGFWTVLGTVVAVIVANALYPVFIAASEERRRKTFVVVSMISNLGILGVFKYFNFFIDSAYGALGFLNWDPAVLRLDIVLPVGISFYTFQTMSYTIDIYRRKMSSTDNFLDFALFVTYFPQLVAGPIERASHLLPAIQAPRTTRFDDVTRGCYLILFGLFKKVAIADGVATSVDAVYGIRGDVTGTDVYLATFLFAFQIYCDFSGYSDIARGSSKLLGIEVMTNFDKPYFSTNPSEFWRRWHISLSSWLRDYLYIPLGGNRLTETKTYRNLMLTMMLGGLWHGAEWNFVVWGIYHGGILGIHRWFSDGRRPIEPEPGAPLHPARWSRLQKMGLILLFFQATLYGWLLFRAQALYAGDDLVMTSFGQVAWFTKELFTDWSWSTIVPRPTFSALLGMPLLVAYEIIEYRAGTVHWYARMPVVFRGALYAVMVLLIVLGTSNAPAQFIYFQF